MKLIGLTGTTGSGKGYVAKQFARYGISCVDTDAVVHRLYAENQDCITMLVKSFGDILTADGSIDRKKLAPIVFSNPSHLQTLNCIVHRFVKEEVERISSSLGAASHCKPDLDPGLFLFIGRLMKEKVLVIQSCPTL